MNLKITKVVVVGAVVAASVLLIAETSVKAMQPGPRQVALAAVVNPHACQTARQAVILHPPHPEVQMDALPAQPTVITDAPRAQAAVLANAGEAVAVLHV